MAKGKYKEWLKPDGLLKLEGWAREGLINTQIADNIGINPDTLYTWIDKYPEISDALKRGKKPADQHVVNKLYQRAIGYEYDEVTQERVLDKDTGEYELKVTKVMKKQVAPDTTAQIFWLKNRMPEEWRDKRDVGVSGDVGVTMGDKKEIMQKMFEDLKNEHES